MQGDCNVIYKMIKKELKTIGEKVFEANKQKD